MSKNLETVQNKIMQKNSKLTIVESRIAQNSLNLMSIKNPNFIKNHKKYGLII